MQRRHPDEHAALLFKKNEQEKVNQAKSSSTASGPRFTQPTLTDTINRNMLWPKNHEYYSVLLCTFVYKI